MPGQYIEFIKKYVKYELPDQYIEFIKKYVKYELAYN